MIQDVQSQFQECSFKGIPFPIESCGLDGGHDHVVHKRYKRNGAFVEPTGLNPNGFPVVIPLLQGLARAGNETWESLYPETYQSLIEAFSDPAPGDFVHPIHGTFLCIATNWNVPVDTSVRNGVILTVNFIETLAEDDEEMVVRSLAAGSPGDAYATLESELEGLVPQPDVPGFSDFFDSVGDFVDGVQAIGDTVSLIGKQVDAKFNKLARDVGRLGDMMASDLAAPPGAVHARQAIDRLYESVLAQKRALEKPFKGQTIREFTVPYDMAIPVLCKLLTTSVADLVKLNPSLVEEPTIMQGTIVKYLKKD